MKYILIIWVCSFIQGNTCMAPMEYPTMYNSWYECSRDAHVESVKLLSKMGYKNVDSVTFYKGYLDYRIKLDVNKYNIFNSSSCTFPVETGNILLFRSSLEHGVKNKKGNNIRISLSFNIFIKGTVGNKEELTELILE